MPDAVAFGPFRLDLTSGRLCRDGRDVEIQPRPLALLQHLASRPGDLVTRAELLASVWGGVRVDPGVVKVAMHALREALEDDGGAPRWIETVGRRGYRFVVDGAPDEPRRPVRAPAPPFVGRNTQIAALREAFERSCGGQRQTIVVTGDAGIGKTALVDRFLADVVPRARVARGQCQEHYGAGEAYLPMHDALRALCAGADGGEAKAILRRCAPSWLAQQPSLTSEAERTTLQLISHGASQERLLRELAEAIEVLAAAQPLVVVLEDLHWSDTSTVDLLVRLAQRREDARLMLVGTHRSDDRALTDHPWRDAARELVAKRLAVEVPLDLLAEHEVVAYVAPCVAVGEADGLGRAVHARTGGNPLFMAHVVDELWSVGATCDGGAWRLRADADVVAQRIPDALRGLLETHLERLTAEQRAVLEAASVVGQVFAAAAVAAALAEPSDAVDEICEDVASAAGALIEPVGLAEWPDGTVSGRYRFRHALYADALRDRIAPTRLGRLHRLIGERLEVGLGDRAHEHAAMLAAHFEAARQRERAERWHDRAGESALRQSAHGVALGHFRKALELLGARPDRPRALALHTKIGMSVAASRGYTAPETEAAFARAVALSEGIEESAELFHAYRGLREFFLVRGEIARARMFAEHLMRLARANDVAAFAIEAEFSMGSVCFYAGDLAAARGRFERALTVGAADQDPAAASLHTHDPVATTLSELALTLWLLGFPDEARRRSAEAVALAESRLPPLGRAHAFSFDAVLHQALGDVTMVRARAAAVRGLAVEHGFPHWLAMSMLLDGWTAAHDGDPARGADLLHTGIAATEAIGAQLGLSYWRVALAQALGASGRVDEALALIDGELRRIDASGERTHESALHRTRGDLLLARAPGRAETGGEAEAAFERALTIARRGEVRAYALPAAVALARLWAETTRARAGRTLVAEEVEAFGVATTPDLAAARALLAGGD